MVDYERIVYCIKLWRKEIEDMQGLHWTVDDLELLLDNEILDGTYCDDEEYNEYLITGII